MSTHTDIRGTEETNGALPEPAAHSTPSPPARPEASSANVRLVRLVSLLLLLQALLLLGITYWLAQGINLATELQQDNLSPVAVDVIAMGFWFTLSGIILLPTALGLFFLRRSAWLIAMAIQALLLVVTLTNFFFSVAPSLERSYRVFMVMASCVVLVFYLNLAGVRTVVQWRDEHLEAHMGEHDTD